MKAVAYKIPGPIDREDALLDITLDTPIAEGRDLLVKVNAVSVNPVDTKLRMGRPPEGGEWQILGYDAVGVVEAIGPEVQNFEAGNAVFYAGSIARPGTNREYHLVDDPAELNVMPLKLKAVSLHWELMFTRPLFETPDMAEQAKLLNEVAALVDAGRIRSTATEVAGKIDAATLRTVHAQIESGSARGKIVLAGVLIQSP